MAEKSTKKRTGKTPSDSAVQSRYIIMPDHANQYGTAFGGVIVGWIDIVAAMAAQKHCCKEAVTVGIDSLIFKEPVKIGDHIVLKACVNYVGRSSMEVGVRVEAEDRRTAEKRHVASAYLSFVSLDGRGKPQPIPPLILVTEEEKRRNQDAQVRKEARLRERRSY